MKFLGYAVLALAVLLLVALVTVSLAKDVAFSWFTQDPAAIAAIHPLSGFLSNIGILLWCSTASICLFTCRVVARQPRRDRLHSFLFAAGILTTILLLDDFFQLHERLFPDYLKLSELPLYVAYGGVTLYIMGRFRLLILSTEYRLLAAALVLFAISVTADVVAAEATFERYLLEDGSKFIGIASWFAYFGQLAEQALTEQAG